MGQSEPFVSQEVDLRNQTQNDCYLGDKGLFNNPAFNRIRYGIHAHYVNWTYMDRAQSFQLTPMLTIMDECVRFSAAILLDVNQNKLNVTEAQELSDAVYFVQKTVRASLREKYSSRRGKRVQKYCGNIHYYQFRM